MVNLDSDQILIVAGEASGDLHGGHLVRALKDQHPQLHFEGVGGKHMQEAGVHTLYNIDRMGGMGLFEFVNSLWHHIEIFRTLSREIAKGKYRAAILINYPFFNLKLAKVCKQSDCPALFYISPQVWASRKGRVNTIRETVSKMYVILPFEEEIFREARVEVEYLGHPFIDIAHPQLSRDEALKEFGLDPALKTVGLLPGSRMSEINYLLDDMLGAAGIIKKELVQCQFLLPVADSIDPELIRQRLGENPLGIKILTGRNYDVMNCSDALIMASGSSTLEAGLFTVPMVIIYKVHPLTYFLARFFTHITHFGLVNIVAGEEVVPELLNEQVTPERIAAEALKVLQDPEHMRAVRNRLQKVRESLGAPGVVARIARSMADSMKLP
ncbi:MAG: lipid-A-disaccharide synthase [Nitrospinota bacterium]|nr:lipid-A-disaccharide synthase [Nitrospinota bacterium]